MYPENFDINFTYHFEWVSFYFKKLVFIDKISKYSKVFVLINAT